MTKIAASLAVAALLLASAAHPALAQSVLQPHSEGDVSFVSGGVAEDSQQAMLAVRKDYNLHLLFAEAVTGGYFANVPIRIINASDAVVVSATSAGPLFYAMLKPGRYTVSAIHRGVWITKTANVPNKGTVDLNFYWPAN